MISLVGIGTAGENIVGHFRDNKEYNVYVLSDNVVRNSKYKYKIKNCDNIEEYEDENSGLKLAKFLGTTEGHVQVFLCGSSRTANATLSILQHIKDKKIDIFYIQPDTDLLIGVPKLQERAIFSILQTYARSGLFFK